MWQLHRSAVRGAGLLDYKLVNDAVEPSTDDVSSTSDHLTLYLPVTSVHVGQSECVTAFDRICLAIFANSDLYTLLRVGFESLGHSVLILRPITNSFRRRERGTFGWTTISLRMICRACAESHSHGFVVIGSHSQRISVIRC